MGEAEMDMHLLRPQIFRPSTSSALPVSIIFVLVYFFTFHDTPQPYRVPYLIFRSRP